MKKVIKFIFVGIVSAVVVLAILFSVLFFFASNMEQEQGAVLSPEEGSTQVVSLVKDIASFDEALITNALTVRVNQKVLSEYLKLKNTNGTIQKVGEPVLQKTIFMSDATHMHFLVPAQFENSIGSYRVHLVHSNGQTKLKSFIYN